MGNANSSDIEQLKQLYSMNFLQLDSLRKELTHQRQLNKTQSHYYKNVINNLQQKQNSIKSKMPDTQFNKVTDFLNNIDRDINSSESLVQTWKPGQSTKSNPVNSQPIRSQPPIKPIIDTNHTQPHVQPHRDYSNIKKSHNEIDPYTLYGFEKGIPFNLKDLKDKYKTYAMQTHPDVNGGNKTNFNIVNNAYKYLLEEHSKMEKDKQFNELKNNSISYIETQGKSGMINQSMDRIGSDGNFNANKFNQVFQDNKLEDTSQEGYNDWLKSNQYETEDIQKDTSITNGNFNDRFNSNVKTSDALQVYQLPRELNSYTSNVQELGVDKVDNFSGDTGKIKYTDLKEAHTTSRLVDPNTKYKTYKNIGDIEHARSNMGDMTTEEQHMIEQFENKRSRDNEQREDNQRRMDRLFSDHHSKMNNIFLGDR
jgi:curved DNA-binding protein CbpA